MCLGGKVPNALRMDEGCGSEMDGQEGYPPPHKRLTQHRLPHTCSCERKVVEGLRGQKSLKAVDMLISQ